MDSNDIDRLQGLQYFVEFVRRPLLARAEAAERRVAELEARLAELEAALRAMTDAETSVGDTQVITLERWLAADEWRTFETLPPVGEMVEINSTFRARRNEDDTYHISDNTTWEGWRPLLSPPRGEWYVGS